MALRDHQPSVIDRFNGLWQRGDYENTPLDHFTDADNLKFVGTSSITTRDGIGISQSVSAPLENIKRIYNYPTPNGNTLIILILNSNNTGQIYHLVNSTTIYGPLLSIAGMTDFAFMPYAGRGYISPFTTYSVGGLNVEKGLQNDFLYVYAGDGTSCRKAAGAGLSGTITIANGAAGYTDPGFHLFGFVSETASGYLCPPASLTSFTTSASSSVSFGNIPTSGDPNVIKRLLVATQAIPSYNGNPQGYTYYFVPNAVINDNTSTFLNNISFFDQSLLDDASHLFDNYTEIPAGAVLCLYSNRLCLFSTYDDISSGLISASGEPEAIDQISGIITMPPDGNPITNAANLRDVLYVTKRSKTGAFQDNQGDPSSWPYIDVDNALGTGVHGIATVIDSGSVSLDFLVICTYAGVTLFNGRYVIPELSWKVESFWQSLDRTLWHQIQIINAPIQKQIMIVLPTKQILVGNYSNGLDPKKIRWMPLSCGPGFNSIAVWNIDQIVIGSDITF